MEKFTITVNTIIDEERDKLPFLYESLLLNTNNNINIIWNIFCDERDEFSKEIVKYFEDIEQDIDNGYLKVKIFYGNLNRFEAEDLLIKNSYGNFLTLAYPDTIFLENAFQIVKDNTFYIKDIYAFAFLEKGKEKYLNEMENTKLIKILLNEKKYPFPIFFNIDYVRKFKNIIKLPNSYNIPREAPKLSYINLDSLGFIFTFNINICQNTGKNKYESKTNEEKIAQSPIIYKCFYEQLLKKGKNFFKEYKLNLIDIIDKYIFSLYILNRKLDTKNIKDSKIKRIIKLRHFFVMPKYNLIYKNKDFHQSVIQNKENEILKRRYININKIDNKTRKEYENSSLNKLNNLNRKDKLVDDHLSNVDFESQNKDKNENKNKNENRLKDKEKNKYKKTNEKETTEEQEEIKEEKEFKDKTIKLKYENNTSSSDYTNYIRNMRLLNEEKLDFKDIINSKNKLKDELNKQKENKESNKSDIELEENAKIDQETKVINIKEDIKEVLKYTESKNVNNEDEYEDKNENNKKVIQNLEVAEKVEEKAIDPESEDIFAKLRRLEENISEDLKKIENYSYEEEIYEEKINEKIEDKKETKLDKEEDKKIDLDLILDNSQVTKKIEIIKEERTKDKINNLSQNSIKENLRILKELEKKEKELLEEKNRLIEEQKKKEEKKRSDAWQELLNRHFSEIMSESKEKDEEKSENKEKIKKQKNEIETEKQNENKIERETKNKKNHTADIEILEDLEEKKKKYLRQLKDKSNTLKNKLDSKIINNEENIKSDIKTNISEYEKKENNQEVKINSLKEAKDLSDEEILKKNLDFLFEGDLF